VFSSNTVVAVFDEPWQPVDSRVVTTPVTAEQLA